MSSLGSSQQPALAYINTTVSFTTVSPPKTKKCSCRYPEITAYNRLKGKSITMSSSDSRQPNSSPPPATRPWTPSRHPSDPPVESDTPGGASRRSSNATTILFTGRQRSARQSSSGGYSSNTESRVTSPRGARSSAPDWRSTASPGNAAAFAISPPGTPSVRTGPFVLPLRSLSAAAGDFNNHTYGNATAATTTAAGTLSPSQNYRGQPQHHYDSSSSLNAIAAATAPVQGPQAPLSPEQASYLVCPW